jgi:hypothetical protein
MGVIRVGQFISLIPVIPGTVYLISPAGKSLPG